jgi:choline dehydrogenase-like flavoprotein
MTLPGGFSGGIKGDGSADERRELSRLEVLRDLSQKRLTREAAAQLLGLGHPQVFRLLNAYRAEHATGLISKRRGRRSNRRKPDALRQAALAQPALKPYGSEEVLPGPGVETDDQVIEEIRVRGVSNLHPVGTCRMGREVDAVVDPRLRVHGIERGRVADASIMPQVPGGNTNAPSIMIGEKCAAMVLERRDGRLTLRIQQKTDIQTPIAQRFGVQITPNG